MKITKKQLRRIIREERARLIINSKYAESPDAVVGKYAIGVLE